MNYLPFRVTEYNDNREDKHVKMHSDCGTVWVRIGKLDIEIMQKDNGVRITALDAELCEQELGQIYVDFDDIEELEDDNTE